MEATYDKNNIDSAFDNDSSHFKFSNMDAGLNISSDLPESHDLEEHQMLSSPTLTKNNYNESNNVHINDKSTDVVDHHQRFVDDFGPETDVDAMDDSNAVKSPVELQTNDSINEYNLSNGVKPFSLENKILQQLSEQNRDFLSDSNPFKNDHFDQYSDEHVMLDETIAKIPSPSGVVDNKIIDALESLAVSNGDQAKYEHEHEKHMEDLLDTRPKSTEVPDFTEKVDYNHEKNLLEPNHAAEADDTFMQHSENTFIQTEQQDATLIEKVDTGLLADTACVEESVGEDTEEEEDEWNYIQGDKKSENNLQSPDIQDNHNPDEAELVEDSTEPQENELVEPVTEPLETPVLNNACDSQLLDLPSASSAEKEETSEKQEEDEKIIEATDPVEEVPDNHVAEEDNLVEDTSEEHQEQPAVLIDEEPAATENTSLITSPSAVTPTPFEDVDHSALIDDHPVEAEQNLLEEKASELITEDKPLAEIVTEPSAELAVEDTSSLEVLAEDTLSTDIEVDPESETVSEAPVIQQTVEEQEFAIEPKTNIEEELERPNSLSLEMASKLNPEAKEFVPVSSPSRSNPTSPVADAPSMVPNSYLMLDDDTVVAQSPKKCVTTMDNIDVPEEVDFQHEMDIRPHELEKPSEYINGNAEISARSHSPASEPSYQELNLKEAMQADEKLEHDYNDEKQVVLEDSPTDLSNEQNILNVLNKEQDPMNMSFYEGRDEALLSNSDELNKVHVLPEEDDYDEQPNDEADKVQVDVCKDAPIEPAQADIMLENKVDITEPETASQATPEEEPQVESKSPAHEEPQVESKSPIQEEPQMESKSPIQEELHVESKSPIQEEPSAAIFAVASQVVNDVAALVDQMQIESPISNDLQETEMKQDEKLELEETPIETEDVMMEQSHEILISLENQSEIKPLEDAVVEEQHTESPLPNAADDDINLHTVETEELASPLVECVQHEVTTENEFITDESVLNVPSPSQPAFSAEAPVEYEPVVEEPAKETTTAIIESVPTETVCEPIETTTATNLLDAVTPALDQVVAKPDVKPVEEPKSAAAPKSATQKASATTKSVGAVKPAATKTATKPSTADKKPAMAAKLPSKPAPTKSSTATKPSTITSTVKKTSTVSSTTRSVGAAKPSTAPSTTTRTSLAGTAANKSAPAEKKTTLMAKKPATSAVNGDVKTATTAARKPLTATTTVKASTATRTSATTTSSSSNGPSARLSGTTAKSTTTKPLTATTKSATSAPAKPSSTAARTLSTVPAAKPRTAPSTVSKTASATSTSTTMSKTSQGSSSAITKRVSTVGTAASRTTTTKPATIATKASSVTSRTSTVSKVSSSSTTSSTVRKTTSTASPTKKPISSPATKTNTKTSVMGRTVASTKVAVSNHVNAEKVPLIEDSVATTDLLDLDKQLKNDNNQLITKNGIDSQMLVFDSAAD